MSDRGHCYPLGNTVLRDGLNIPNAPVLELAERELVAHSLLEPWPTGDLDHLKAIHRHLFRDAPAWAGEVRRVEVVKGESRFQPRPYAAQHTRSSSWGSRRLQGSERRNHDLVATLQYHTYG